MFKKEKDKRQRQDQGPLQRSTMSPCWGGGGQEWSVFRCRTEKLMTKWPEWRTHRVWRGRSQEPKDYSVIGEACGPHSEQTEERGVRWP